MAVGRKAAALNNAVTVTILVLTYALTVPTTAQDTNNTDDEIPAAGTILQVTAEKAAQQYHTLHRKSFFPTLRLQPPAEILFANFITKYEKEYSSKEEHSKRLGIFAENLIRAAEHQALDPTAVHGVTPFMDLSEEEFETMYLGLKGGGGGRTANIIAEPAAESKLDIVSSDRLPDSWDWRERGAVSEVKTQGTCGSCWAFSTTGAIEGASFVATGKLLNLSEQQLVDCDHQCDATNKDECDSGCRGGLMTNAYNYLISTAGGLMSEDAYPYTGKQGECKFDPNKTAVQITNFTSIPIDEDRIAAHLVRHGPLALGLNAVFMQTYIGGVSCPLICGGKKWVNHGVLLVGYGSKGYSILRFGYKPYWIIKNSWGKKWGEDGYYKLCKGHGMCGMNTMVSAVAVSRAASMK